jgi:hypothetical protein
MKCVVASLLGCVAVAVQSDFAHFKVVHKRAYGSQQEEQARAQAFDANMLHAKELERRDTGTAAYGVSPQADYTSAEFERMAGFKHDEFELMSRDLPLFPSYTDNPSPVDWVAKGAVTDVKNQVCAGGGVGDRKIETDNRTQQNKPCSLFPVGRVWQLLEFFRHRGHRGPTLYQKREPGLALGTTTDGLR